MDEFKAVIIMVTIVVVAVIMLNSKYPIIELVKLKFYEKLYLRIEKLVNNPDLPIHTFLECTAYQINIMRRVRAIYSHIGDPRSANLNVSDDLVAAAIAIYSHPGINSEINPSQFERSIIRTYLNFGDAMSLELENPYHQKRLLHLIKFLD